MLSLIEWNPVSEGVPAHGDIYLVLGTLKYPWTKEQPFIDVARYKGKHIDGLWDTINVLDEGQSIYCKLTITHWACLPNPYNLMSTYADTDSIRSKTAITKWLNDIYGKRASVESEESNGVQHGHSLQ